MIRIHANMENCLKLLPHKSYNTFDLIFLSLFVFIGCFVIGFGKDFDSKATLQCYPDKNLASNISIRKLETECLLKYEQKFYPSLPIYVLLVMNIGLVLVVSIIYAYLVKDRVEIFANHASATTLDPMASQRPGRYFIFTVYVSHVILCRIILLAVFALLLNSSNFPVQFHCLWPMKTTSMPRANLATRPITNFLTVDCNYPTGGKNEMLVAISIIVNFLFGTVALTRLACLMWSTWNDRDLCTDFEFCCVYLLGKREGNRELIKNIRKNISKDICYLYDDFGEERLSRRKLEEIYVNVIIQEGRESTSRITLKNRHETYKAHFKAPVDATLLRETADLFKPTGACKDHPRTILVVGRPGIGKTLLTKMLFYEWQQQKSEFWHGKLVILIRFRKFNKGETSLRKMLRCSDGHNMSSAFNYIYEYICWFPRNVILIFDGLDELKVNDETLAEERTVNSHDEDAHILLIFKQLVKGELLPGVTVLTTSRPTAEYIYRQDLEFDREVEILGFHEEQIKSYVETFCRNDKQNLSSEIWSLIKESPELLSLCYIPVNSYIVCLTLKESIDVDEQRAEGKSNVPRTITELYKRAIKVLLFRHHLEYKDKLPPKNYFNAKLPEPLQNDLDRLKGIARDGIIKDQLIFDQQDYQSVAKLANCGLLNQLEDKRQNFFCFLHLTIQEFLAALHVVDDMDNVESFLFNHINNPKWHLVCQFVSGLIGDKIRELNKQNLSKRYA